jgi:elongation of very long chain fatty acids protein 6
MTKKQPTKIFKITNDCRTEINFDPAPIRNWMVANPSVPIIAVVLYAVFIVYGQQVYFKDRPAWNWRSIMALWNLGLSVFSFIGFVRVLPHLIHNFTNYTLKENFCNDPESHYGSGSTGLWLMLFILSKFP